MTVLRVSTTSEGNEGDLLVRRADERDFEIVQPRLLHRHANAEEVTRPLQLLVRTEAFQGDLRFGGDLLAVLHLEHEEGHGLAVLEDLLAVLVDPARALLDLRDARRSDRPTRRRSVRLHFEITTGDTIWPDSYARAVDAYGKAGMQLSKDATKAGGHCQFDQQQVIIDRITPML